MSGAGFRPSPVTGSELVRVIPTVEVPFSAADYYTTVADIAQQGGAGHFLPLTAGAGSPLTGELFGTSASFSAGAYGPIFDAASASSLSIGTTNASSIDLGKSACTVTARGAFVAVRGATGPSFESAPGSDLILSPGGNTHSITFGDPSYGIGVMGAMTMGANASAALLNWYGTIESQFFTQPGATYTLGSAAMTPSVNLLSNWTGAYTGNSLFAPYSIVIPTDSVDTSGAPNEYGAGVVISHNIATGAKGGRNTLEVNQTIVSAITGDSTIQQYSSGAFLTYIQANVGGTSGSFRGYFYGAASQIRAYSGATYLQLINAAGETDVALTAGSSAQDVVGGTLILEGDHVVAGSRTNATFQVGSQPGAVGTWTNGYTYGSISGPWPMASSATMNGTIFQQFIGNTDKSGAFPPYLATNGTDWSAINFSQQSGYAFRSPGFSADGTGQAIVAQGTALGRNGASYTIDVPKTYAVNSVAVNVAGTPIVGTASSQANYYPGDIVYGTSTPSPGQYKITNTQVISAALSVGGSGGTNGTQTVTGTTGTGTPFQASVTISGGAITAVLSITVPGNYTANPTNPSAEPVTGASLTGAKLAIGIGALTVSVLVPDVFATNITAIAPLHGSGLGLTLTATNQTRNSLSLMPSSGSLTVGGPININNTTQQIQIAGMNAIRLGTDPYNPMMMIGKGAGALLGLGAMWELGVGYGALANDINTTGGENNAFGGLSSNQLTTGSDNSSFGHHSLGQEKTGNHNSIFGNDAARNAVGVYATTGMGKDAFRNGSMTFSTALGFQAGFANQGSITVGGTKTTGNSISLIFTSSAIAGSPVTLTYVVQAGDTIATITSALAALINGNSAIANAGTIAVLDPVNTNVIGLDGIGTSGTGISLVVTYSLSGGATETIAIGGGATGYDNIFVGNQAGFGSALAGASLNIGIGKQALLSKVSGSYSTAIGSLSAQLETTGQYNTYFGALTGQSNLTGYSNTYIGYGAGNTATNAANTILGAMDTNATQQQITTGGQNLVIGYNAMVPSASASGQMSIANTIYAIGATGTGSTVSTAQVGISVAANPLYTLSTANSLQVGGALANYVTMNGTATLGVPEIDFYGSDTNVFGTIRVKGTASALYIYADSKPLTSFFAVNGSDGCISILPGISASVTAVINAPANNNLALGGAPLGVPLLSTSATTGFVMLPSMSGSPSGTPVNSGDGAAYVVNGSSKNLNIYIPGVGWYHAALSAGAA